MSLNDRINLDGVSYVAAWPNGDRQANEVGQVTIFTHDDDHDLTSINLTVKQAKRFRKLLKRAIKAAEAEAGGL
jgi:hypothetical protein